MYAFYGLVFAVLRKLSSFFNCYFSTQCTFFNFCLGEDCVFPNNTIAVLLLYQGGPEGRAIALLKPTKITLFTIRKTAFFMSGHFVAHCFVTVL